MKNLDIISEEHNKELSLYSEDMHIRIKLTDLETGKLLFDQVCDTFITGDFILHLERAVKKLKSKDKYKPINLILSRWYPKIHNRYFVNMVDYPYITTIFARTNNSYKVKFKVTIKNKEELIFETSLEELDRFLKNK